jgi:outer membrane protein OmpA-like peptidoglycan-associated protein
MMRRSSTPEGHERAAVERRTSVFSFGEEKPVALNTAKDARAENRRVVVRVLS